MYKDLYDRAKKRPVYRKHNERNAGRKPQIHKHIDAVIKLINENKDISTREIAKRIGISHNSVAKLLKIIENKKDHT
jgi:predicted HTH transcriptional regulator